MMIRDRIESMSSEGGDDESQTAPLQDDGPQDRLSDGGKENGIESHSPAHAHNREQMEMADQKPKKKSSTCCSYVNKNLVTLKILLFVFYGGLGVLSTWLNHSLLSKRFSEKETSLAYGLASLFSIPIPFIFGIISDKSAQPKKVLAVSLVLAALIYPLILTVPTAVSYHYKEKFDWCRDTGRNESSCLPYVLNCTATDAELITDYGVCSEGCGGKLILTNCRYECGHGSKAFKIAASTGRKRPNQPKLIDYNTDHDTSPGEAVAAAQIAPEDPDHEEGDDVDVSHIPDPHVCIQTNSKKLGRVCKVYDNKMEDIVLQLSGITGYTEIKGDDGRCHYPVHGILHGKDTPEPLISCPQLSGTSCYVVCTPRWNLAEVDQWICRDDYLQWLIAFSVFVAVHTLGTMLLISAAGLLNSAVVCMVHEHEHGGYLGFQLIFGTLGYAILTPLIAFLFQFFQVADWDALPWDLEYVLGFSVWLLLSALLTCTLYYDAEWVPKVGTVRPMLSKWCFRGQNLLFFEMIISLGCFQGILDVLSYYQIKGTGGDLMIIGLGAAAAVLPAIIFIFRVERVIDYCGYHNVLCIALVVIALQLTGYAYLEDVSPYWSFMLKGLDTFSIVMAWITASVTTHNLAPRSLVATCQTMVVIFYCCIGRGLGSVLCYVGLQYLTKEYLLKTCSMLAIILCIIFLIIHYWCLKPVPYTKKFKMEKPVTQGTPGNYKPLKFISKKDKPEEDDEL